MTEFPFSAEPSPEEAGGRDRKTLLLAGGLALAVVVGGGYFFLSSGGDDASNDVAFVKAPRPARTPVVSTATALRGEGVMEMSTLPADSQLAVGRNPFKPLYVQPVQAPARSAAIPSSPAIQSTGVNSVAVTPSKPVLGQPAAPGEPPVTKHRLVLSSVTGGKSPTARFTIDGKAYAIPVGKVFGPTEEIQLVALQQDGSGKWNAVLRVGDSSPFDAGQGEALYVL